MPAKLTTEQFIEKARAVHGDRYDYSSTDYKNARSKVTIICPSHGPFAQLPQAHRRGQGCPRCAPTRRLNTEGFIQKAKAVHGDRYDYSRAGYVDSFTKVTITCPEHGPFEQSPNNHINKSAGCPICGDSRLTSRDFESKARAVHGDRYDYSSVTYVNAHTKVTIICRVHGPFEQMPYSHIYHSRGCPACADLSQALTTEEFIERAKAVHGNRYDYSRSEYVNNRAKVTIICPNHGAFEQAPQSHIGQQQGCPECAQKKQLTSETFAEKASVVHGDRYDYSEVKYVNNSTPVTIICPIHGTFIQKPNHHLSGAGCPGCAEYGFNPNEPALLYYLAVTADDGNTLYKVGITKHEVEARFPAPDLARIRVVKTWRYFSGHRAAKREAEILRQYAGDRYFGPDVLAGPGNSELFTHDILGLDRDD